MNADAVDDRLQLDGPNSLPEAELLGLFSGSRGPGTSSVLFLERELLRDGEDGQTGGSRDLGSARIGGRRCWSQERPISGAVGPPRDAASSGSGRPPRTDRPPAFPWHLPEVFRVEAGWLIEEPRKRAGGTLGTHRSAGPSPSGSTEPRGRRLPSRR